MIQLLYTNTHQIVETPWGYTKEIKINRGIRQGCALSMTLFTISIEPFLQKIKNNIKGIDCDGTIYKTLAYADDTVIFLHDDRDQDILNKILTVYEKASGAKINKEKNTRIIFRR